MQKVALIISVIINIILIYLLCCNKKTIDSDLIIEEIDSLELQIDSVNYQRDSIKVVIDTVYIQIESNNKEYEENVSIIISNSVNDDFKFFLEYLNENRARYDSINNS